MKPPAPKAVFLDPHPPKYHTPVPSLPRDPLVPHDMPELLPADPANRDTDRVIGESGEHEVLEVDPEKTPIDSLYSLKGVSEKLDKVLEVARDAANQTVATRSEVRVFAEALQALTKRVTALEVSGKWAPLTLSAVALLAVLWLAFQVQGLQSQLQMLHH